MCRLAEGRQPWTSSTVTPRPQHDLTDAESGIWSLAAPQTPGGLVVGGTETGMLMAWDLRTPSAAWQVRHAKYALLARPLRFSGIVSSLNNRCKQFQEVFAAKHDLEIATLKFL